MSLTVKITVAILLALTTLLSLFAWTFIEDEEAVLNNLLARQGEAMANAVSAFSIEPLLVEDYPVLESVLATIGAHTPEVVSLEVVHEGKRVAAYQRKGLADASRFFTSQIFFPAFNVRDAGTVLGEVRLELSESTGQAIVAERLTKTRIYIGIAFIVLAGVLGLILRRLVLQRIEALTRYAEKIAAEHADAFRSPLLHAHSRGDVVPEPQASRRGSADEITRLAVSLSLMRRAIDQKQRLVQRYTETLEQAVADRTRALIVEKERAESSARAKTTFLANMSHEIRTPMNGVIGFTRLLFQTEMNAKQQEYVRTIALSADNLRTIIDDILDYTKIEAGGMDVELRPVELQDIIDASVTLMMPQAYAKGLELVHGVAVRASSSILTDPMRLRQILTNLLDNAVKFTAEGTVSVWVESVADQEDSRLRFEVRDSGIGVAPAYIPNLFSPFSQADASVTRRFGGTGLGLAISKQLVERMGGRMGVESTPRKGSLFWFELPVGAVPEPAAEGDRSSRLRGRRALVCEPGDQARRALEHCLRRMGMAVRALDRYGDLANVANEASDAPPELLVLGARGEEGLRQLRPWLDRLHTGNRSKILLWVNSNDLPASFEGMRGKSDLVLSKATGYEALARALEDVLAVGEPTAVASVREDTASEPAMSHLRVLVVDDNSINRKLSKAVLEAKGVRVWEAGSGHEAIGLFQENPVDLILMDIQMPGMSGLDATRQIRKLEQGRRHTPIIAVTAHAYPEEQERFLRGGIDGCLSKPLDSATLWRLVKRWTGRAVSVTPAPVLEAPVEGLVYDREAALRVTGGNEQTADELWGLFLERLPEHQHRIMAAAASNDMPGLQSEVHSLAGAAAYCGAIALKEAASGLDRSLHKDEHDDLGRQVDAVQGEIARVLALVQDADGGVVSDPGTG